MIINNFLSGGTDVSEVDLPQNSALSGYNYVNSNGILIPGTMVNQGSVGAQTIKPGNTYTIPEGYHNGSGTVGVDMSSVSVGLAGSNVLAGYKFYNASGQLLSGSMATYSGSTSVTPSSSSQTLSTYGRYMRSDITINAISSDYKRCCSVTQTLTSSSHSISFNHTLGAVPSEVILFTNALSATQTVSNGIIIGGYVSSSIFKLISVVGASSSQMTVRTYDGTLSCTTTTVTISTTYAIPYFISKLQYGIYVFE